MQANTLGQVEGYYYDCPENDYCSIVYSNAYINSRICGGLITRIKSPRAQYFEYKTFSKPVRLQKDETIGCAIFINYETDYERVLDRKFIAVDDFSPKKFFEYVNSNTAPLGNFVNSSPNKRGGRQYPLSPSKRGGRQYPSS